MHFSVMMLHVPEKYNYKHALQWPTTHVVLEEVYVFVRPLTQKTDKNGEVLHPLPLLGLACGGWVGGTISALVKGQHSKREHRLSCLLFDASCPHPK
jgi:hypothetical protein